MATNGSTAFLFPGQGAQAVGMGADVYANAPAGRAVFDEADTTLGFSLTKLILNGPAEELRRTEHAQPAIFCVSVALLRAMEERLGAAMPMPAFVAGHSLGEYTALVAAGVVDFADGLRLVRLRGQLMQAAGDRAPTGMAAVLGMELQALRQVCDEAGVQVANINSPEQAVVAGPLEALERAAALAQERGARRVVPLEVSGAFHTEAMRPAQREMDQALQAVELRPAAVPIVANTTAEPLTAPDAVRQELADQLCGCVLWRQSVELMAGRGVTRFIEIGPGKVLSGLVRRIAPEVQSLAMGDLDALTALTVS